MRYNTPSFSGKRSADYLVSVENPAIGGSNNVCETYPPMLVDGTYMYAGSTAGHAQMTLPVGELSEGLDASIPGGIADGGECDSVVVNPSCADVDFS